MCCVLNIIQTSSKTQKISLHTIVNNSEDQPGRLPLQKKLLPSLPSPFLSYPIHLQIPLLFSALAPVSCEGGVTTKLSGERRSGRLIKLKPVCREAWRGADNSSPIGGQFAGFGQSDRVMAQGLCGDEQRDLASFMHRIRSNYTKQT